MATPTSYNTVVTFNEDIPQVLTEANFPFSDADVEDTLAKVKIMALPVKGLLTLDTNPMTVGQEVSMASLQAGLLVYTPEANTNGSAYSFIQYQVSDGANYSITHTLTFNVTAVNDAPIASSYNIVVFKNTTYTGELPNAIDVKGTTIVYSLVTTPTTGAIATVSSNGAFVYVPKLDTVGTDSFVYSVSDGVLSNTYTVSITLIATVVIPITDVTTISGCPTSLGQAQTMVQGNGVFDKLMEAVNVHLALQLLEGRITGTDYANVYLASMVEAMKQSITFVLQKPISERQAISEEAKTTLIIRQTKGFDDDAKQKLLKQALDSWSVAYSVAQDANSIPDAIKVNPIDSIMKSAMDALSITKINNPLGE